MLLKCVCVTFFLAGALAQFDETSETPERLSADCAAAIEAKDAVDNTVWIQANLLFENVFGFMCALQELVPPFTGYYRATRCDFGLNFLEEVVDELDYYVYEIEVLELITREEDGAEQVNIVRIFDAIPTVCTADDYDIYEESRVSIIRDLVEAEFPTADYNSSVSGTFFAYDAGYPANYGEGYQTTAYLDGQQFVEASTVHIMCDDCSTPWIVDIDVPARYDLTDTSVLITAFLNADVNFEGAGCLAKYATLAGNGDTYSQAVDNINIFCKDDAEITISVNDGEASPITDFHEDEDDDGSWSTTGARVAFDSLATTNLLGSTGSASSAAPAVVVAALAVLASVYSIC